MIEGQIRLEIIERINRVYARDSPWAGKEFKDLPDDPHVQQFLNPATDEKISQGRVGYCFQPLVEHVAGKLGEDLSFIVLMNLNHLEQCAPNVPMGQLDFCSINNLKSDSDSQLRFRKIFRFVGSDWFSRSSIQTSKILFEKSEPNGSSSHQYIYSLEEPTTANDRADINVIPVGPLYNAVRRSFHFENLQKFVRESLPEHIGREVGRKFERFYQDGDLENFLIQRAPHIVDRSCLAAFEQLLVTFNLRRSADLRRRFLNYLLWMLLCDEHIKSYSYIAAMRDNLPHGEFIIASRAPADPDLISQVRDITLEAFGLLFERQSPGGQPSKGTGPSGKGRKQVKGHAQSDAPAEQQRHAAVLADERGAIHKVIQTRKSEEEGSDTSIRKAKAVLGLDNALLRYVGPIITKTFLSPHRHLSLDPFWSETASPGDFKPYIADLTLQALKEEAEPTLGTLREESLSQGKRPRSRVNPFLMAMFPVADYLAKETRDIRKSVIKSDPSLSPENRRLGELPLDESGLLSMNIVFWDIATTRFRYCSINFINNDPIFDYTFNRFFRLIDTLDVHYTDSKAVGRGVLGSVLLMSDVLFRKSTGEIEPACIIFQDAEIPPDGRAALSQFHSISVAKYIEYLNEEGVREQFHKMYTEVLLETEENKPNSQERFEAFCSDPTVRHGVRAFLNKNRPSIDEVVTFLKRYNLKISGQGREEEEVVARFFGYITWLWLCYRERLAYYYYIPAQLPFNERVGGFAIATEVPLPDDIIDFLFVSIVPRIVAHPALMHHREAVTQYSHAIQQCWFDSFLHLIYNGYGLKNLKKNLENIIGNLHEIRPALEQQQQSKVAGIQTKLEDALKQLGRIPELESELKRMLDDQISPDQKMVTSEWLFQLSLSLSSTYAQSHRASVLAPDYKSMNSLKLHSPILLVVWHAILNACRASGELPDKVDRRVHITTTLDGDGQRLKISVSNLALPPTAKRLNETGRLKGLQKDRAILETLWLAKVPAVAHAEPLEFNVRPETVDNLELARVEVTINAPAITQAP